jgi:hypothetical protein
MFPLAVLVAGFVSVQALFAAADAPAWETHSYRLLDAATDTPLAGTKVLVFPKTEPGSQWKSHARIDLQSDPLGGRLIPKRPLDFGPDPQNPSPAVSDAEGNVALPVPSQDANMLVMDERGIAFLHEGQWNQKGGDVHASLQAWASLSGTVTLRGKQRRVSSSHSLARR